MSPSRRPAWTAWAVDVSLVVVLLGLSLWLGDRVINAVHQNNPKIHYVSPQARLLVAWAWIATAVQLALIPLCRRLPLVAWLVSAVMLVVHVDVVTRLAVLAPHPVGFAPLVPSDAVVLVALFAVTVRYRLAVAVPVLVTALGLAIYSTHSPLFGPRTTSALLLLSVAAATFIAALGARSRSAYLNELLQRNADLDRARIREAEVAAINERSRLAREIHDTVAHALGIIVVQAQGAAAAQARRPELTSTALTAIVEVGRGALAEMRTLLSADTNADSDERTPPRGIRDLPALVQRLRDTGSVVDLDLAVVDDPLPPSLDHCLFRIVQESLTNAVKHTGADRRIVVRIHAGDGCVDVDVHSAGTPLGPAAPDVGTGGRGLDGMGERVAMLGGTIETGFDPDGGFTVHAQLPSAVRT